jgi:translocation and assembly module TamB
MRRLRNIALWAAAIGIVLPVALLLAVLVVANTAPGQALIARLAGRFSGGMVMLSGLHGRFPDRLRLDRLEMHDRAGVWLTADGVALDWSPVSLISLQALVDNVSIAHLALTRLPAPAPAAQAPAPAKGGFSLPVRVTLRAVHVGQADIAAAGANSSLKIDGAADVVSLRQGEVTLAADRLDSAGTYRVAARLDHGDLEAKLSATEPAHGLIGTLAQLPDLGAISLLAGVTGPKGAERTDVSLHAGQLSATLHGVVDLSGQAATLDVAANAPAMQPRPDISWQGIDLRAHVNGRFTSPDAAAHLVVRNLAAGGASMQTLTADAGGNRGKVDLHAVLQGLRLPGPKPDVFAQAPWDLTLQAMLDQPDRPVSFTLTHPLLTARGTAKTASDITAEVHAVVADIAPLAALGNVDLRGSTDAVARLAMHGGDTQVSVQGTADFTGGQAPVPSLLGPTRFSAAAGLAGQDITVNSVQVDGRGLHAHVSGTDRPAGLDLDWQLGLTDLALAAPQLTGALQAEGHAGGKQSGLAVTATIHGDVGTRTIRKGPVTVSLRATGLPASPAGSIDATGRLDGSDLVLAADISRDAGGITRALLKQAKWKSLSASADATLQPGGFVPQGRIQARMGRLADLAGLTGLDLSGGATASIVSEGQGSAMDTKIDVRGSDLSVQANRVGALKLAGRVTGAPDRPDLDLLMTADGIDAAGVTGAARATAKGTLGALDLAASAGLHNVAGDDASVSTTARLDTAAKTILLRRLDAGAKGLALRLQAPAA